MGGRAFLGRRLQSCRRGGLFGRGGGRRGRSRRGRLVLYWRRERRGGGRPVVDRRLGRRARPSPQLVVLERRPIRNVLPPNLGIAAYDAAGQKALDALRGHRAGLPAVRQPVEPPVCPGLSAVAPGRSSAAPIEEIVHKAVLPTKHRQWSLFAATSSRFRLFGCDYIRLAPSCKPARPGVKRYGLREDPR